MDNNQIVYIKSQLILIHVKCPGDCFGGAADPSWPHDVCAAVLSLCAEAALGGRDTLVRVLDPLLLKMGDKASFACMDRFAAPPYAVIH